MAQEKSAPYDVAAEEAVIGSLLIDPEAILRVGGVSGADFFDETNQAIFEACYSLFQRSEVINQITVAHELMRRGKLEQVGGAAYLSHLISIVPTSVHVEHYAQIVSRTATMRRLITAAGQIADIGYESGSDVEGSLNKAEDILFQVRAGQESRDFVLLRDVLGEYFEEGRELAVPGEGEIACVMTGFRGLDELLGGLQRSDLVVLAARPSLGKTSLALNIARNAALDQGGCVALFSLEMSRDSVVQRMLSGEAGVDFGHVRWGRFGEKDERRVMEASGAPAEARIYIDDSPQVRVMDIRSKARRLHFEQTIDLVIVDYLQLIQGSSSGRSENRVQELSQITRSLKMVARELNVPVLAVSQLSRAVEHRPSHIPQLADLRESGSIEQDADVVMFIHREDMLFSVEEWNRQHDLEQEPYPRGLADVLVAKHRNGPLGQIKLRFLSNLVKFDNLASEPVASS